jgi:cytoskeletal protein CcmA (bactofilin family)
MFRRKKTEGDDARQASDIKDDSLAAPHLKTTARAALPGAVPTTPAAPQPRVPTMPPRPGADLPRTNEMPRRMTDTFGNSPSSAPTAAPPSPNTPSAAHLRGESSTRQLIVGREISLSGEITACDRLIVEGSVEANLANCRDIDIAESGLFKGSASIDEAEIRGRFEGVLTVRKRLFIRATGKVVGTIRYGQIEVECGGQISGDIQATAMPDASADKTEPARPMLGELPTLERSDLHPARIN